MLIRCADCPLVAKCSKSVMLPPDSNALACCSFINNWCDATHCAECRYLPKVTWLCDECRKEGAIGHFSLGTCANCGAYGALEAHQEVE